MKTLVLAAGIVALFGLSACSKGPQGDKYVCQGNVEFYVDVKQDKATLYIHGDAKELTSVPAGSGAKFVSDEHMFWSHQNTAMLGEGQNLHKECKKQA
ncbi:MliC family protein [Motilimonas sp. KMU-193]|uniref:MliC family protein n=1 Tax=Motilimonas sp. KMU-193 TaxID=3388668 RepID=UPI00396B18D4